MPIYEPSLWLSKDDREILAILAQLVIAQTDDECSNLDPSHVTLSPSEAARLLLLLEEFLGSKLFVEGAYFVENLANGEGWHDDRLREIYLSWRKKRGQSRMMSGRRWMEFTLRSGFSSSQDAMMFKSVLQNPLRPMALSHFVAMEKRLVSAAGLKHYSMPSANPACSTTFHRALACRWPKGRLQACLAMLIFGQ